MCVTEMSANSLMKREWERLFKLYVFAMGRHHIAISDKHRGRQEFWLSVRRRLVSALYAQEYRMGQP